MRKEILLLIAKQFWINVFKTKAVYLLMGLTLILLCYSAYSGDSYYKQNLHRINHQKKARESWEKNPDKHPHRMAHFGTFAFRQKHPLSTFDFGTESYTGNVVFLEAHKQHDTVFSELSFSTGLLRLGELSMAMILQIILPLIIFFIGYSSIVSDRRNGTLKIVLTQGASRKEILFGKSFGLIAVSLLFFLPFIITTSILLVANNIFNGSEWIRLSLISLLYFMYIIIVCLFTIFLSAKSQSSKNALVKLLGVWLLMIVLLPKTTQVLAVYFYKTPNKLEFKSSVEKGILQIGNSHNPFDPHFQSLKDSVLKVHNVKSVEELPFNYGGFVMKQSEKLSTRIFRKHYNQLLSQYRKQNYLNQWLALINPYLALKNLSMSFSATDFESYVSFQNQAEQYRYQLAQKMNELQMRYIDSKRVSGSEGKKYVVSHLEWKNFPDFKYNQLPFMSVIKNNFISLISMLILTLFSVRLIVNLSKKLNVI